MRDFNAAVASLSASLKVRRASWPKGTFCTVEKRGHKHYAFIHRAKYTEPQPHVFYWDDFTATDWQIVA